MPAGWVLGGWFGRGGLGGADGGLVVRFGRVVWVVGLLCCLAVLGGAAADAAGAATLYAYADGAGTPAGCPQEPSAAGGCSLAQALAVAGAGDTVELASPGASEGGANYTGNWTVSTPGTSAQAPVTIDGGGVSDATLDGNRGSASGCSTSACDGPVLTVGAGVFVVVKNLTVQNADNTASGRGGGVQNDAGGTMTITNVTFTGNQALDGGAVDNGDDGGSGTVTITDSTFTGNSTAGSSPSDGGALDNGDHGGTGTMTVADSTLSGDLAVDGGEIDTGDNSGGGSLVLHASTLAAGGGDPDVTAGRNGGGGQVFVAGNVFAASCQQNGGTWNEKLDVAADGTCGTNGVNGYVDAGSVAALKLAPLADYGGATQTIGLGAGSPAIGRIEKPTVVTLNGQTVALCAGSDQRGQPRPGTGKLLCDAGAYETQEPTVLYAYADGGTGAADCPKTSPATDGCSLTQALSVASAGDTIELASPGAGAGGANYVGNWDIDTANTSAGAPITIDGSGVSDATLDGNHGNPTGCTTSTCNGPVLFVGQATVVLKGMTIQNGAGNGKGGGVRNIESGTVTITDCTFKDDSGVEGGAIGSNSTLAITDSTFTDNTADDGGAIDNLNDGTATITGSTFTGNSTTADGGAIDNADNGDTAITSSASLAVSDSTFTGNTAGSDGGAIDNADVGAGITGTVTVTDSTLSGDSAAHGGEIDTNGVAPGVLVVAGSTLSAASGSDVAAGTGGGQVFVAGDLFASGCEQNGGTWTDQGLTSSRAPVASTVVSAMISRRLSARWTSARWPTTAVRRRRSRSGRAARRSGSSRTRPRSRSTGTRSRCARAPISAGSRGPAAARRMRRRRVRDPGANGIDHHSGPRSVLRDRAQRHGDLQLHRRRRRPRDQRVHRSGRPKHGRRAGHREASGRTR